MSSNEDLAARLLSLPNVVGVDLSEVGVTVFAVRMIDPSLLSEKDRIPREVGGKPVVIVETGPISAECASEES